MPRSRDQIQAEIDALQAELDSSQPEVYTARCVNSTRTVELRRRIPGCGGIYINNQTTLDVMDTWALRDWLNYHFPKTEENA